MQYDFIMRITVSGNTSNEAEDALCAALSNVGCIDDLEIEAIRDENGDLIEED